MELGVQCMDGPEHTLELASWAEDFGLESIAPADHYIAMSGEAWDQLTLLAAVALSTRTIGLATLVSPITFRHPAVMLKAATTIDRISGGRFSLGIGAGWMVREHEAFGIDMPPVSERFERLEEALGYLRAAMDPGGPGFSGDYYTLEGFTPDPVPDGLKLIVGGSGGRKTPYLAGTYADEYNAYPGPEVDFAANIENARRAATEAGRDPDSLFISTAFPTVVGADRNEIERNLRIVASRRNTDPDSLKGQFTSQGIPFGEPGRVAEGVARLADHGIQRIYLQVSYLPIDHIRATVETFASAIS